MIKIRQLERYLHYCMLLLLMGVIIPLWQQMSGVDVFTADGDPLQQKILLVGYLLAISILLLYPRRAVRVALRSSLPWLLISLALISFLWSDIPTVTLRRSIAILLTTLYGLTLAVRFNFEELLDLVGYACLTALFASLAFSILLPEWGRMVYFGKEAWRGAFIHKNTLGLFSAFSFLVFGASWKISSSFRHRWIWGIGIILAIISLIKSRSASGLVLTALILLGTVLLSILYSLRRVWQIVLPITLLVGGILLILIAENYESLLSFLGRDQFLTGRLPLWKFLIPMGLKHLWGGYGFGAFWTGWEGPSALVWQASPWHPPHSHNGYLDIFLNLGLLGLLLTIVLLMRLLYLAFKRLQLSRAEGNFWILFCGFLIILNFVESSLVRQNNIFWTLLVYAIISMNNQIWINKGNL